MGKNVNKCINCQEYRNCRDSFSSWFFFIIGIIATIAVRVVTVLIPISPVYAKVAWYIGVIGFFLFFIYKFKVSNARAKAIHQRALVEKINRKEALSHDDYALIGSILCALDSNKERINYFFIFALSAIALILAIYIDFLK